MQIDDEVRAALETLRRHAAGNEFELHRIDVLERDLTAPPVAEIIDERHQKFDGLTYYKAARTDHMVGNHSIHRTIWTYYYGEIPTGYEVHHRDLNPQNNDITNFQLLTSSEHQKVHAELRKLNPAREFVCLECGKVFYTRVKLKEVKFCSRLCQRRNARKARAEIRICQNCGKEFSADRCSPTRYCSKNCYYESKRRIPTTKQ